MSIRSHRSASRVDAAATASIDPGQLLTTCTKIRENMDKLNKSIKLTQLRLITLSYMGDGQENNYYDDSSLRCSDDLIELCNLSQQLVHQLDLLNTKLGENVENSISYRVASQQLIYFTSEWYDNLTPKFNETFEMAERLNLASTGSGHSTLKPINSTDIRVRDALIRLRQSMNENERLIGTISANIEYTRTTIESIYNSLQSSKFELNASEQNTIGAIKLIRDSRRWAIILLISLFVIIFLVALYVFKLLGFI